MIPRRDTAWADQAVEALDETERRDTWDALAGREGDWTDDDVALYEALMRRAR